MNSIVAAASWAISAGIGMRTALRPLIVPRISRSFFQRDVLATENVAMPIPSAFHHKKQSRRDIAHVDVVHNKIKVHLNSSTKKIS